MELRPASPDELSDLSALCLRSKAFWGYDLAFLKACEQELSLSAEDLERTEVVVAADGKELLGVAQVLVDDDGGCYLEKLFVNPERMGRGAGRALYAWAVDTARRLGAESLIVESDPDAAPFYAHLGAERAGTTKSGSIPGRYLPRLVHRL